jgi:hypothetical protein
VTFAPGALDDLLNPLFPSNCCRLSILLAVGRVARSGAWHIEACRPRAGIIMRKAASSISIERVDD